MQYRNDRNLRQDLFFPACFLIISIEAIGGEFGDQEADFIKQKAKEYCLQFGDEKRFKKVFKSIINETYDILEPLKDKKEKIMDGVKLMLTLYNLACIINDNPSLFIPPFCQEIFDRHFENIEKQNVRFLVRNGEVIEEELDADEWERLRESTKKHALKIFQILNQRNYFKWN